MAVIYILLAFLAVFLFWKKYYVAFLFIYLGVITGFFMLDPVTNSGFCGDVCIIMNILLLPLLPARYKKSDYENSTHPVNYTLWPANDRFGIMLYCYLLFYVFEFIITLFAGAETLLPALKVIRISLLPQVYFIFKCIPLKAQERFFRLGLYLTLFQGLLYYLQFAGIHLIAGYDKEKTQIEGFNFALNYPTLTVFYIFYILRSDRYGKFKYVLLLYLLGMVIMTYARMFIVSVFLGIILYLALDHKRNRLQTMAVVAVMLVTVPVVTFVFATKNANRSRSAAEDISQVINDFNYLDTYTSSSGSFTFRMAMLVERFTYLLDNPEYLALGVGTIHEDSPKCYNRFDFILGTVNKERMYGKCLIESGDNAWIPVTLRYGIVGILLHMAYFVVAFLVFVKRKDALVFLAPVILISFINSFDGSFFENPVCLYLFSLFAAWAARADIEGIQVEI